MRLEISIAIISIALSSSLEAQISSKDQINANSRLRGEPPTGGSMRPWQKLIEDLILSSEEEQTREALSTRPECWMFSLGMHTTPSNAVPQSIKAYELGLGKGSSSTESPAAYAPIKTGVEEGNISAEWGRMLAKRQWYFSLRGAFRRNLNRVNYERDRVKYLSMEVNNAPALASRISARLGRSLWLGVAPEWERTYSQIRNEVDLGASVAISSTAFQKDIMRLSVGLEYQSPALHAGVEYMIISDPDSPSRQINVPTRWSLFSGYFLGLKIGSSVSQDEINSHESTHENQFAVSLGRQVSWFAWELSAEHASAIISGNPDNGHRDNDEIILGVGKGFFKGRRWLGKLSYKKFSLETPSHVRNKKTAYAVSLAVVDFN